MDLDAHLGQRVLEGRPARVLAEHDLALAGTDGLRIHDLVGGPFPEHAVLVDARFVGEGVAPDHSLVELHRVARESAHHSAGAGQFADLDSHFDLGELLLAGTDGHDDLLHGRVARPLTDPVDGALDLACARGDGGQRVGDGEAEVVVAVGADDVLTRHPLADRPNAIGPLDRHGEADRVGDVEGAGAVVDGSLEHVAHEVEVGAGGVLRRKLDVFGVLTGPGHGRDRLVQHLRGAHAQLVLHVGGAGGDEDVDAPLLGRLDGLPAAVDVLVGGAGQAADDRATHRRSDGMHGVEVALAGDWEASLDVVDAQACQLVGDLELLADVQGDARGLLAVAEGGVEDDHPFLRCRCAHGVFLSGCSVNRLVDWCRCGRTAPENRRTPRPGGGRCGRTRMWTFALGQKQEVEVLSHQETV